MIDFETDLRDRFDRAAAVTPSPDLLATVERRIVTRGRRTTALRVAGAVAVVALASGIAVAATGGDGADTDPTVATDPPATTEAGTTTTAPPAAEPGWAEMADAPIAPRSDHLAVAMEDEVLVWGGVSLTPDETFDAPPTFLTDGAVYDPAADTWRTIPESPLPGPATGVWTGTEAVLVSSGPPQTDPDAAPGPTSAAAFDPATDTWRAVAAPPEGVGPYGIALAWTGTHVVAVTGGDLADARIDTTVALYDPATDTWTSGASTEPLSPDSVVVATPDEVLVVGGANTDPGDDALDEVLVRAYDPEADAWRELPWGLSPGSRVNMVVAWTGDRLFVGGGMTFDGDEQARATEAALLDPATGEWTEAAPAPTGFFGPLEGPAVWTGDRVVTVGAGDGGLPISVPGPNAALAYDPATDTWTEGPARSDSDEYGAPWAWAAGRVVVPLGAVPGPIGEESASELSPIPGGATYTP